MKTVILRHATLAKYLPSILRRGLLCSKSRGKKRVVWACAPEVSYWAVLHTLRRHGGMPQDVVVLEIAVPSAWLKRHGGAAQGLFYLPHDVPPENIRRITTFGELSKSPVEEPAA
jgi:hypothetical protein